MVDILEGVPGPLCQHHLFYLVVLYNQGQGKLRLGLGLAIGLGRDNQLPAVVCLEPACPAALSGAGGAVLPTPLVCLLIFSLIFLPLLITPLSALQLLKYFEIHTPPCLNQCNSILQCYYLAPSPWTTTATTLLQSPLIHTYTYIYICKYMLQFIVVEESDDDDDDALWLCSKFVVSKVQQYEGCSSREKKRALSVEKENLCVRQWQVAWWGLKIERYGRRLCVL